MREYLVLIETLWNVKTYRFAMVSDSPAEVLIETLWNVKLCNTA